MICKECRYFTNEGGAVSDCRGHAPSVEAGKTYWPQVSPDDLACFNYKQVAEESNKDDAEQLYEYIRIARRRTLKQIENHFNWGQEQLNHAVSLLKANNYITGKQQGVAYYLIAVDENKKYVGNTINTRQWLLNTLTTDRPTAMTQLINHFKEDTGLGIPADFIPSLKQLKEDKFIVVTKGTYEDKECQFFRLNS